MPKCQIDTCYRTGMLNGYCLPHWNVMSQEERTRATVKNTAYGKWSADELTETMITSMEAIEGYREGLGRPGDAAYTRKDQTNLETFGVYFPPLDRCFYAGTIDGRNDGRPEEATLAIMGDRRFILDGFSGDISEAIAQGQKVKEESEETILEITHVKKVDKIPRGFVCAANGQPYSVTHILYCERYKILEPYAYVWNLDIKKIDKGGLFIINGHVKVDFANDNISAAYRFEDQRNQKFIASHRFYTKHYTAMALSAEADRKNLWTVRGFKSDETKQMLFGNIMFGVYPEHIQSLFHARDAPLTETGRRNPILHWVSAHKKLSSLNKPIEIDEYLRGTTRLEIGDMTFLITEPSKMPEREPFHLWARKNCKFRD